MLSKLREAKLREIDADAKRKKAAAIYIVNCIERDESLFRRAFFGDDFEPEDQDEADADLYAMVEGTIAELTNEYTRPFGVTTYHLKPGNEDMPAARLGWATYWPPGYMDEEELARQEEAPHTMRLTETGINVINGLRDVLGLPTLEAQRQRNRAPLDAAVESVGQPPST